MQFCVRSVSLKPLKLFQAYLDESLYICKAQSDNVSCIRTITQACIFLELFSFDHLTLRH